MSRGAKIWIGVGVASVLAVLLCCSGVIWLGVISTRGPTDIMVTVDCPVEAVPQSKFDIAVRVVNVGSKPREIHSIDVYDGYLDGIVFTDSDPPWRSSFDQFGFTTFDYRLAIPPGEERIVTFHAMAAKPGDFGGDLDVCVDNQFNFTTQVVRTVVREE